MKTEKTGARTSEPEFSAGGQTCTDNSPYKILIPVFGCSYDSRKVLDNRNSQNIWRKIRAYLSAIQTRDPCFRVLFVEKKSPPPVSGSIGYLSALTLSSALQGFLTLPAVLECFLPRAGIWQEIRA